MTGCWVPHDTRDAIVDYLNYWTERAEVEVSVKQLIAWLGIGDSKFYSWKKRDGNVHEHDGQVPRDFWLEDWEKQAILNYHQQQPLEGCRRLAFMIRDAAVVSVRPSSVHRVLREADMIDR